MDAETDSDSGVSVDMEAKLGAGGDHDIEKGPTYEEDLSFQQEYSFTLADESPIDLFDVKVTRDPIYGTPIFQTMGGRSMCPHEEGTDNQDNFLLHFALDDIFTEFKGNDKSGTLIVDSAKCASVNVIIQNVVPGGEEVFARRLFLDRGRGLSTLAGIAFKINGKIEDVKNLVPLKGDNIQQRYLISFCPVDSRELEIKPINKDGTTENITKGVYRDISIVLASACEMDMLPNKMWLRQDTDEDCDPDGFPKTGAKSNVCVQPTKNFHDRMKVQPTNCYPDEFSRPDEFPRQEAKEKICEIVYEQYLRSRVFIECLSFVGEFGCDSTKC